MYHYAEIYDFDAIKIVMELCNGEACLTCYGSVKLNLQTEDAKALDVILKERIEKSKVFWIPPLERGR